jgi:hypothetical protein
MCNLYSLTKGQQAIRELARAMSDRTGNLPLLPGIYPDYRAACEDEDCSSDGGGCTASLSGRRLAPAQRESAPDMTMMCLTTYRACPTEAFFKP